MVPGAIWMLGPPAAGEPPKAVVVLATGITGAAGAGPDKCKVGKANYCQDQTHGFLVVDVSGRNFRVGFFVQGISPPVRTLNFSKP